MIWNSKTLSAALGITISNSINCNEVQFNSKDVKKGDLFIALKGNRDGHDYVLEAIDKGAAAVIVSKQVEIKDKENIILVDDCFEALQKMALYKLENSKAKFIAITGSVGKTSTKEALKILLQHDSLVFASRGNFNNKLGMLINLASMADDTEYAIFELGMNHKGEIRELVQILKPNIAMITNISEAHLEFFNSLEEIAEAKCEIFKNFSKNDIAVINADTNCYSKILSILKNLSIDKIYSFGTLSIKSTAVSRFLNRHCEHSKTAWQSRKNNKKCYKLVFFTGLLRQLLCNFLAMTKKYELYNNTTTPAQLVLYENLGEQVHLKYKINNKSLEITIPFIPRHFAENYTGVLLIIDILDKDIEIAANHLADIAPTKGRGEIINIQNCRVICDYYNASPQSMKAALEYLKQVPAENKTAIIGGMLELGESSKPLHEELIPYILNAGCSKVYLVGVNTKYIYDLLPPKIAKKYFKNVDELITHITDLFESNELILIKGSRGVKLDKIVDYYK